MQEFTISVGSVTECRELRGPWRETMQIRQLRGGEGITNNQSPHL